MKRFAILISLLFSVFVSYSQANKQQGLAALYTVSTPATSGGEGDFIVSGFMNDPLGIYEVDSVEVGHIVWDASGNRFVIEEINSRSGNTISLDLTALTDDTPVFDTGVGCIQDETGMLPIVIIGGLSDIVRQSIDNHRRIVSRYDEIQSLYTIGSQLYITGSLVPIDLDTVVGTTIYSGASPTTMTVGGISSGTAITGLSLQDIIEDLLVPYIAPTFATFIISGQSTTIEVGDSISGSKNFTWTFTNGANVTATTMDIADLTTPATLYTNISNTPPQAHNFTPSIRKTTATSHSWRGSATNTQSTVFNSSSFTVSWQHKRYWGWCPDSTPSDAEILSVSDELSTTRAKSAFTATVSGSDRNIFYAYPASFGDLTSLTVGGFESLPAFTKTTRSFVNDFGVTISYNIYVSNNTFSANITNIVTQ